VTVYRWRAALLAAAVLCAELLPIGGVPAAAQPVQRESAAPRPGTLHLQTVPALAGVAVKVDGAVAHSDSAGRITVRVHNFIGLDTRITVPETQISPDRKVVFDRFRGSPDSGVAGKAIELGLRTSRLVSWRYVDRFGSEVPTSRVHSMRLRSNTGEIMDASGPSLVRPQWVPESRTQQGPAGLVSKRLYYVVDSAIVGGASVVNRAQQRFVPWDQVQWLVQLLFFKVTFSSTDLFFTEQVGRGIVLSRPDGSIDRLPFDSNGEVVVPDLPRGTYSVKVYGGGVSFARPVSISKDQAVALSVVSHLDLVLIGGTLLTAALGLILLGRPHLRPRRWRSSRRRWRRPWPPWRRQRPEPVEAPARGRATVAVGLLIGLLLGVLGQPDQAQAQRQPGPVPVLAYYYIWFNPTSWNRAKTDYPLLGRYSSDDEEIMRRHVRMAKAAGINGFLVSWKHTPQLDERLATLVSVARAEQFHLGIVYQGLDFERQPLPIETVVTDLALFADTYAADPVFNLFGKPLVIWSGTERFGRAEIESTGRGVRAKLLLLGDAKSVEAAEANGPLLDGQAYYWSSVDPTRGNSREKLAAMSRAVHHSGGLWVAPAAPGFDARLVGGARAVPRRDGQTLRESFDAARSSEPDAVGVISFNEFSENTHIEPSERYGTTDINVLADLLGARTGISVTVDSSASDEDHWGLTTWGALLLIGGGTVLLPVVVALWRRRRLSAAADRQLNDLQDTSVEQL
jgi:hypothetical protein